MSEAAQELTPREFQIVSALASGLCEKDIALRLSISQKTVSTHKVNLYRKLGVHSDIECVVTCIRRGWVAV